MRCAIKWPDKRAAKPFFSSRSRCKNSYIQPAISSDNRREHTKLARSLPLPDQCKLRQNTNSTIMTHDPMQGNRSTPAPSLRLPVYRVPERQMSQKVLIIDDEPTTLD